MAQVYFHRVHEDHHYSICIRPDDPVRGGSGTVEFTDGTQKPWRSPGLPVWIDVGSHVNITVREGSSVVYYDISEVVP